MGTAWAGNESDGAYISTVDLTGKDRHFAAVGSDPTTAIVAGAGDPVRGVFDLTVPDAAGLAVTVLPSGIRPVYAGEALAAHDVVASDASGRAVVAKPGDFIAGTVHKGCGAGEIALIRLTCHPQPAQLMPVYFGTAAVDAPSLATQTGGTATATIAGVEVGDFVTMQPPAGYDDGVFVVSAHVTAANTVTVALFNASGGTVDAASASFSYVWHDRT